MLKSVEHECEVALEEVVGPELSAAFMVMVSLDILMASLVALDVMVTRSFPMILMMIRLIRA